MAKTRSNKGKGRATKTSKVGKKPKTPSKSPTKKVPKKDREDPFAEDPAERVDPFADENEAEEMVNNGNEIHEDELPSLQLNTVVNVWTSIVVKKDDRKFLLKANKNAAMLHAKLVTAEDINVWDGARVHTVTGTALAMAEAASTVSMNKSVVKGFKKCQALLGAAN